MELERVANILVDAAAAEQGRRLHRSAANEECFRINLQLSGRVLRLQGPFLSSTLDFSNASTGQQPAPRFEEPWDESLAHRLPRATVIIGALVAEPARHFQAAPAQARRPVLQFQRGRRGGLRQQ